MLYLLAVLWAGIVRSAAHHMGWWSVFRWTSRQPAQGFGAVTLVLSVLDNPIRLVSGGGQQILGIVPQRSDMQSCTARFAS